MSHSKEAIHQATTEILLQEEEVKAKAKVAAVELEAASRRNLMASKSLKEKLRKEEQAETAQVAQSLGRPKML